MGNCLKAEAKTKKLGISDFKVNHMYLVETSDKKYKKCFVLITEKRGTMYIGMGRSESDPFDVQMRAKTAAELKKYKDYQEARGEERASLGYFWSGDDKQYQLFSAQEVTNGAQGVNLVRGSSFRIKTVDGEKDRGGTPVKFKVGRGWLWMNPGAEEKGGVVVKVYKSSYLQKALQKSRGEIPMGFKQFRF